MTTEPPRPPTGTSPPAPAPASPAPNTRAATTATRVHLVAGGDMVAVFADPKAAAIQYHVMVGANLDTIRRTVSATTWATMRERLRETAPDLEIVDARPDGER